MATGRGALIVVRAQASQESQTVDQRHAQVEDDRVGMALLGLPQAVFGADRRADLIAFEAQHPRKRLRDPFVVVDDQDFRRSLFSH